jgi:cell division protein FtsQ
MAKRQADETRRAEKIRARRQKSQKQTPQPAVRVSATRKQTKRNVPVTRRHTSPPPMVNRGRNTIPVPLKSKGAEVHLPAFPNLHFGWRFISGAIFVLALIAVISFSSLNNFKVNAIALEGAQRLSPESILSQIDLSGTSIIRVKPQEIQEKVLERFPSLSSAKVSVGLPATVSLRVTERQPVILWQQESGSMWIDADGVTFPIRGESEVAFTVLANGMPPAAALAQPEEVPETEAEQPLETLSALAPEPIYPRTTPEFVQGIIALSDYVPEGSSLQYDPDFGLGWTDPRGWLVYFGNDISNIDLKLIEYESITASLQEKNLTPALISLEFLYAPFYRLEH